MPLVFSSLSTVPFFHFNQFKLYDLKFKSSCPSNPNFTFSCCNIQLGLPFFSQKNCPIFRNRPLRNRPPSTLRFVARDCMNSNDLSFGEYNSSTDDWEDQEGEIEDMGTPWEGAVVYQRNPSISHVEYCTTLERLGLGKLSTEVSKSRASVMGLRVTKAVKDFPLGTPVLISVDVTRKKRKLRLDGIIRTVITLACNRCGEPAAECVFSNFSLLLTEEPIEEPETFDMGVIFGQDKFKTSRSSEKEEDDEESIDLDDRLYFPHEEKTIDISKHIRDMVHIEITINALCDPKCKGLCLKCGSNLNIASCTCSNEDTEKKGHGPLGGLREQMQKV